MSTSRKTIIAMDGMSKEDSLALAQETKGMVWGFKLHELLLREHIGDLIQEFKAYGNVFADLKFHDIPDKVYQEVTALTEFGADLMTVHASGGKAMLEQAVAAGGARVVAVTALTSLTEEDTATIYQKTPQETVETLATLAETSGVSNIVCSPHEIPVVKRVAPQTNIITPGIRAETDEKHDQKRTMSAPEAVSAGAGLLVIGRPITKAPQPREALQAILDSLA